MATPTTTATVMSVREKEVLTAAEKKARIHQCTLY